MEKKVVVMGAEDVAAMRKAHREAEAAYFQAKVGALEFAMAEMGAHAGEEYTLSELTAMTGLTSMEVTAQLSWGCKAAQEAGWSQVPIRRNKRTTVHKFVEVNEDGSINPMNVMTVTRNEHTYYIPNQKPARR
jgi:hypothetical protein